MVYSYLAFDEDITVLKSGAPAVSVCVVISFFFFLFFYKQLHFLPDFMFTHGSAPTTDDR